MEILQWKTSVFSTNGGGTNGHPLDKEEELELILCILQKISLKGSIHLLLY